MSLQTLVVDLYCLHVPLCCARLPSRRSATLSSALVWPEVRWRCTSLLVSETAKMRTSFRRSRGFTKRRLSITNGDDLRKRQSTSLRPSDCANRTQDCASALSPQPHFTKDAQSLSWNHLRSHGFHFTSGGIGICWGSHKMCCSNVIECECRKSATLLRNILLFM